MMYLPRAECVFLITAILIESFATVALNVITIITFVSHRQVRKHSTYILISLAVADMLVGAVTAPINLMEFGDVYCGLWKDNLIGNNWYLHNAVYPLFPFVSLSNLVAVSLERLYVTVCPYRYRSVKAKAYGIVIATVWLIPTLTTIVIIFPLKKALETFYFIWTFYTCVALFTICVCYLIIFIKVRCSSLPRRHGVANRERKLTITLFIVTAVSLLTWLPWVVFNIHFGFLRDIFNKMSRVIFVTIREVARILYLANSLVNPVVYSIRMPEFRKAASTVLCKKPRGRVEQIRLDLRAPNI